jgi:hypothetical protein
VKGEQLVHIYGVHYDMDEKLRGHPVFHGQMSSQNGGGGLHLRFVFTGGNIPAKLYEDLYYYVEGRAEVTLTFVNLTAPFSSSWASSIVKSVMARAKSIAG